MKPVRTALVAALLALAPGAQAVLLLSASVDGGAPVTAIDNDLTNTCGAVAVGCQLPDVDPAVGVLTVLQKDIGSAGLIVGISTQTADSVPGFSRIDSTGTQFTNNTAAAHTFAVAIGATNFVGPSNTASATGAGQWSTLGGPFGASDITMRWFDDPANAQGGLNPGAAQPGNLLATFFNAAGPGNPSSFSINLGPFAVSDPNDYSMTLQFNGTIGGGVRLTGREMTEVKTNVPEPATALLLGAVLVGLGLARKRG